MAAEQWYLVGQLPALVQGDDSKCAAAARLPIDREILGVDLAGSEGSVTGPRQYRVYIRA